MPKKFLSLNLVILMLLSFVALPALASEPAQQSDTRAEEPAQYIMIDGVKYDATKNQSGNGWNIYYSEGSQTSTLHLTNYVGGPIVCNGNLNISIQGTNTIVGKAGCGIYAAGNIWNNSYYPSSRLNVTGADGYPAIHAGGVLGLMCEFTVSGGGVPAFEGSSISLIRLWPTKVCYGKDAENTTETNYIGTWDAGEFCNENYIHMERLPYTLTLHGNGGRTATGEETHSVSFTAGTAGSLQLYYHQNTFTNENRMLLGWSDSATYSEDGFHPLDENYTFSTGSLEAELYAVWEDVTNKAVVLNNYYGPFEGGTGAYNGTTKRVRVAVGDAFVLPESRKSGTVMLGWRGGDGHLYPAGTEIEITETVNFTAEYETLYLEIDGSRYPTDTNHGSYALGWHYYSSGQTPQLDIWENYSGEPIKVPTDVRISQLHKSFTGTEGEPAIEVNGNAEIHCISAIELVGGDGCPALDIAGDLDLVYFLDEDEEFYLIGGGEAIPAVSVGGNMEAVIGSLYAGASKETITFTIGYSGEHVVSVGEYIAPPNPDSVTLTGLATVPAPPEKTGQEFVAWSEERGNFLEWKWFLPGNVIDAGEGITINPHYISPNDLSMVLLIDGRGGQTEDGSTCFVSYASSSQLITYEDVDCVFSQRGKRFLGYNSSPSGGGEEFQEGTQLTSDKLIHKYYAVWSDEDNTEFAGGTGTEADPYLIANKTHLNNVRNYLDAHFKMTADIVFTAEDFSEGGAFYNGGAGWEPIGTFTGYFDGASHTITGLYQNISATTKVSGGLFSYTESATIKNLDMVGSNITVATTSGGAYAGGIVGNCGYFSTIVKCSNSGNISGDSYAGGIAGRVSHNSDIVDCSNTGEISRGNYAGGIVGYVYNSGSINNSNNSGDISGYVSGGVVGGASTTKAFSVRNCYNTGDICGESDAGGIIGDSAAAEYAVAQIGFCYNSGNVIGKYYSGGIIAFANQYANIYCCYNAGRISVPPKEDNLIHCAGGIIGYARFEVDLGACYNVGSVSSITYGGIAGRFGWSNCTVSNCYYLDNVSIGISNGTDTTTKCSDAELKNQATFVGFSFDIAWTMSGNPSYPYPELIGVPHNQMGSLITGSALSWNNTDDAVYVLYASTITDEAIKAEWAAGSYTGLVCTGKETPVSVTVDGKAMYSQSFSFYEVANGSYKLAIFKPGKYVPKIIEITVSGSTVDLGQQKLWLYGDVNYDKTVNILDAVQIQMYKAGKTSVFTDGTPIDIADRMAAANVTAATMGDAVINVLDAVQIQMYKAGKTSAFNSMK